MNTTGNLVISGNDLSDVIKLDQDYFTNPWSCEQWQDLNRNHHTILKWEESGQIFGFALFSTVGGSDTAHLFKILIHPERQGSSLTSLFWTATVRKIQEMGFKKIYLEVEIKNERAVRFYEKVGFLALRRVKNYYSNGGDALMMQLTLVV